MKTSSESPMMMIRIWITICFVLVGMMITIVPTSNAIRITPNMRSSSSSVDDHQHLRRDLSSNDVESNHVDVVVPTNPDDHLVTSLPLLNNDDFPTKHWAGLLPASNDTTKYLFYWLFEPADANGQPIPDIASKNDIPLIIWLNGGPGCSSMDGLFIENGPFRFVLSDPNDKMSQWKLMPEKHSWHKVPAYTVYIDQPVGTGLSFVQTSASSYKKKYPTNDQEVNIDFYYFLQSFFALHSDKFTTADKKQLRRPLYFSGESHAGHYIPSMMAFILKQNENAANRDYNNIVLNLTGAAIGNGWMDPFNQYAAGRAAYGYGIIDDAQLNALNEKEQQCQAKLNSGNYANGICFDLLDDIVGQSHGSADKYKISQYDHSKLEPKGAARTFPLGHKTVEMYLGGKGSNAEGGSFPSQSLYEEVLKAVHAWEGRVAGQYYQECTDPPYNALAHQDGMGVVNDVISVLDHGDNEIQLLFFNGMNDLICNHVGNEIFLTKMKWKFQTEWIKSGRYAWRAHSEATKGKINGYMKEYKNLLFLKLMDCGHMVPMDMPNVASDMMKVFTNVDSSSTFAYSSQSLKSEPANPNESCPLCPAPQQCDGGNVSDDYFSMVKSSVGGGADGTQIIAYAWLVAIVVIMVVVVLLYMARTRGNFYGRRRLPRHMNGGDNSSNGVHDDHQAVATTDDLELRNMKYRDSKD